MQLKSIRDNATGIYLTLGAAIVGLPGCATDTQQGDWGTPTAQAEPARGVVTVVQETEPGQFKIQDEQITEGPSRLVIMYADSTVKTVSDPDTFATLLPQTPPQPQQVVNHTGGFGLGNILLMSMIMNAWRPAYYAPGVMYTPPRNAYANNLTYDRVRNNVYPAYTGYANRGLAPTGAQSYKNMRSFDPTMRSAPSVRSTNPANGRSGFRVGSGGTGGSRGIGG